MDAKWWQCLFYVQNVQKSVYKEVDEEMEQAKADEWPEMSEISTDLYVKPLEKIRGKVPWELYWKAI